MKMTDMKHTKEYYLSLTYKEKIKTLAQAMKIDFYYFLIVARYYLEAREEEGGLSAKTVDREFAKGLKRNHYFKHKINE